MFFCIFLLLNIHTGNVEVFRVFNKWEPPGEDGLGAGRRRRRLGGVSRSASLCFVFAGLLGRGCSPGVTVLITRALKPSRRHIPAVRRAYLRPGDQTASEPDASRSLCWRLAGKVSLRAACLRSQ